MQVEHHPLSIEFPEFKDAIHALKLSNAHFAKLFNEYDDADKAVNRAENGVDSLGDAALENLKKVRVTLKDQLYQLLQATAAA
ncbi:YdcH family protein [Herminiimonas sp. CN]|uniref:YdcH family protein n=1 Tax=Herminiimonas sp. CN TaxID=1349818 RepID=UPI000474133C|nr:YdcH family protein [Herminiimonas sp. CN]